MTEKEKCRLGLLYDANYDPEILADRERAKELLYDYNRLRPSEQIRRTELLKKLLGKTGENLIIEPPFACDYGYNIEVGENFYANVNLVILDGAKVCIGDNAFIAPNVGIYTAGHPIYPDTRNSAFEYGKEVTIGDNVWLGGNTVVCPGVHIGDNVVIGAGSVVTKDIPSWSIAAGNPCRVIRKITEDDKRKLFHDEEIDEEAWGMICAKEKD